MNKALTIFMPPVRLIKNQHKHCENSISELHHGKYRFCKLGSNLTEVTSLPIHPFHNRTISHTLRKLATRALH